MNFIENTLDKKEELCELLKGFSYEIHLRDDDEYHYLKDGDICITLKNADKDKDKLYLDLEEEFTLTFGAFHNHYDCSQNGYDELVTDLNGILQSKIGVASIYHYYDGKLNWLGSRLISIEETESQTVKQIFQHTYHAKDFRNDLERYGGEACYIFWDSRFDKTIKIEQKRLCY